MKGAAAGAESWPAKEFLGPLVEAYGDGALAALDVLLEQVPTVELAALAYEWDFWARPKQKPPPTNWRSITFMTGRAFGKTRGAAEFVIGEAYAGRAKMIGLCAGTDDDTYDVMVAGETGLIECSPPWWKAKFEDGRVVFPNGAIAVPFSAMKPEHFRGRNLDLFWGDELGSWAKQTWAEAWHNMKMALRSGHCRLINTLTPRKVPIVRMILERAKKFPDRHLIVTGATWENASLPEEFLDEMRDDYAGTRLGLQELEGVYLEDVPGAIFSEADITANRRSAPEQFVRIIVSVDPAISTRKGTDQTGIVVAGLGLDRQIYVLADRSGKHSADAWAAIVLDLAEAWADDADEVLVVGETNRGGDLVEANLKAATRGTKRAMPAFKGVHARRGKENRAEPVAAMYVKGRISHVKGAELAELEEQMTTWDPTQGESPDRLDALVHAVWELAALAKGEREDGDYASITSEARIFGAARRAFRDEGDDEEDDDGDGFIG